GSLLQQAVETVQRSTTSLKVLLVEGEAGIGKSRFLAELRLRCVLNGVNFFVWQCTQLFDELTPVRRGLHKLRYGLNSSSQSSKHELEIFTPAICEYLETSADPPLLPERKHPRERLISDVITMLNSLARRNPMVLAIEDIHLADSATLLLLEQLAFRA